MNKNAIKTFAITARVILKESVKQKAFEYGIEENSELVMNLDVVNGRVLTNTEKKQRQELVDQIRNKGFDQVIEEVAYTWFNRFIALRYMEVNDYLPEHVRVFSDAEGKFNPQILKEALSVELEGLDKAYISDLMENQKSEELYKYMLIAMCNRLNEALPVMFEKIQNYTELLLPNNLLKNDSILASMVNDIPEEDWTDQVQIIGWLYQYYNSELKDETFALLKKNVKITKERIPAATQLFTPDWIVRYMVENSLGRLWTEGHPNEEIKKNWKYYLEEAKQEPEVEEELKKIRAEYAKINPEDIKVIDPCMGSGHILVYAFEVLMQIYESVGYSQRDAAELILQKNLYGLDIDDRAGQLAYFAVMMMARKYSRRILSKGIIPNVMSIQDSKAVTIDAIKYLANGNAKMQQDLINIKNVLEDAKEYGSILNVPMADFEAIYKRIEEVKDGAIDRIEDLANKANVETYLLPMVKQAEVMAQKYDVCVTNPPYMGGSGMSGKLSDFVKENYPDSKSDLFACFIEKCSKLSNENGYYAMIVQPSLLFLSSFEKLRVKMMTQGTISSLLHMGRGIFGIDFGSTAYVVSKQKVSMYRGCYFRLHERTFQYIDPDDIAKLFLSAKGNSSYKYDFSTYKTDHDESIQEVSSGKAMQIYYETNSENFSKIPGSPVAYWVSENIQNAFSEFDLFGQYGDTKKGVLTGNDVVFTRIWFEVSVNRIGFNISNYNDMIRKNYKWIPATSGGSFRKWFGNFETIINMENDSYEIRYKNNNNFRLRDSQYYFRECITWSEVSSKLLSNRYVPQGILFGNSGPVCFFDTDVLWYLSGLLNSVVSLSFLQFLSPTMTFGPEQIKRIPAYISETQKPKIDVVVQENIAFSKNDWDSFEISWDFKKHPLI